MNCSNFFFGQCAISRSDLFLMIVKVMIVLGDLLMLLLNCLIWLVELHGGHC